MGSSNVYIVHCRAVWQKAIRMTSLSLEDFILLPAQHVRHLVGAIQHLIDCPIRDVAGSHVTALQHVFAGIMQINEYIYFLHHSVNFTNMF